MGSREDIDIAIIYPGGSSMDDIEKTFSKIDSKVDRKLKFVKYFFNRYFPVVSTLFFAVIILVFAIRIFYSRPRIIASIIEDDVKLVTLVLEKIDAKCNILNIEDDYNEVNFLNVASFKGSQVGPINLAYPDRWEGPYLRVNPTIQKKFYEIVRAKDGYFVMPGKGVRLPHGLVMGEDIKITSETAVRPMLERESPLLYEGRFFAAKLMFKVGDWDSWHMREKTVHDLNRMLKEFGEAMPFTYNNPVNTKKCNASLDVLRA
jgi:hypothetical protein